jgi:hypothetical protein
MTDKLNLLGIKTPNGIYVSNFNQDSDWRPFDQVANYKINGDYPQRTFDANWNLIKSEPKTVTIFMSPQRVNRRFELKNPALASDKIPLSIPENIIVIDEDDGSWLNEMYSDLRPLYHLKYDEVPQPEREIEFTYTQILETDNLQNFKELDWEVYRNNWKDHPCKLSIDKLQYQWIDKIRFPSIYYKTNCPVALPSREFYDIIRMHVVKNIDTAAAFVDSNYDFCFRVKKHIRLNDPKVIKTEQLKRNGKRYKTPVYTSKTVHYASDVIVFSMTHDQKGYQDFPVLPDIHANNLEELQKKVDNILEKLMDYINTPMKVCPCCNGSGVEHKIDESIDINALISGAGE